MSRKLLVVLVLGALLLGACTRSSTGSTASATPQQVYAAGLPVTQVRSLLGSDLWWPGPPTFGVRPLDLAQTPETVRFSITQRYAHLGTPEIFAVQYVSFSSSADATTQLNNVQSSLGQNAITTPKVGDQTIYSGQKLQTNTALYDTSTLIRLGAMVLSVELTQVSGFPAINTLAKVGNALVSRLKDVLTRKVKPSPVTTDQLALLPPAGTDITMVGAAQLPIEATAGLFNAADPQGFARTFSDLGVNEFDYGDYALNADLHMEVQAAVFTFGSDADAGTWIDEVVGKSNLDSSGVAAGYSDAIGQYYGVFAASSHVGFVTCKSTDSTEAAARACELPLTRVITAWQTSLSH